MNISSGHRIFAFIQARNWASSIISAASGLLLWKLGQHRCCDISSPRGQIWKNANNRQFDRCWPSSGGWPWPRPWAGDGLNGREDQVHVFDLCQSDGVCVPSGSQLLSDITGSRFNISTKNRYLHTRKTRVFTRSFQELFWSQINEWKQSGCSKCSAVASHVIHYDYLWRTPIVRMDWISAFLQQPTFCGG